MTRGNHDCSHGPCLAGSSNANSVAFTQALVPISRTPHRAFDVQTSLGLATFVAIADSSWDTTRQTWRLPRGWLAGPRGEAPGAAGVRGRPRTRSADGG